MISGLPQEVFHWAGYVGVAFYLCSFGLLQSGVIRGTGYPYILMNLAAACLVLVSLIVAFNLSSALIQISWIAIGLFGLARRYFQNRRVRFSVQEDAFRTTVFPRAPVTQVRRFLDAGEWTTLSPGAQMTHEGEPVETLFFVASGYAEALNSGKSVGWIEQGFVGEMNVLQKGPASATVRAVTDLRVFVVSGDALRRLSARDAEMKTFIEDGLITDTRRKLIAANARLVERSAAE